MSINTDELHYHAMSPPLLYLRPLFCTLHIIIVFLAITSQTHLVFALVLGNNAHASIADDRDIVKQQLGYIPSNYLCVSARTATGSPIAIKTYPLLKKEQNVSNNGKRSKLVELGSPFPTHYWLTSPDISWAIAEIERQGYIRSIMEYLNLESNFELRQQLLFCHQKCGEERWSLLSRKDQELLSVSSAQQDATLQSMRDMIRNSGIAGTNYQILTSKDGELMEISIKCLHTHYAHFRSTNLHCDVPNPSENPVGRITHELLLKDFPSVQL